ncbi:MAG: SagB/ThcOx family dehydrogenase [Bacillota bacterium]
MKTVALMILVLGLCICAPGCGNAPAEDTPVPSSPRTVPLPEPSLKGERSLEEAITLRMSVREYASTPVSLECLAQVLWAAAGRTDTADAVSGATRPAPSAGATHPLEVYVAAGDVKTLPPGVYRYDRDAHSLEPVLDGDFRKSVAQAALGQAAVENAPVTVIIAADYTRTTGRYGERGTRYVHMEAGGATQNMCLQAASLGMGCVVVGAFDDNALKDSLGILEEPVLLVPVGWPAP